MRKAAPERTPARRRPGTLTLRKPVAMIEAEMRSHGLKRSLGAVNLTMLGIGSTIGAGIYVMTGTAAAEYAGPAILLSFLVAGLACLFTALSYGELASSMPVSGSAYTYAYASMGELAAWVVGWLLVLEYGVSCAGVAAGFSGYATSLLSDLGLHLPAWCSTSSRWASAPCTPRTGHRSCRRTRAASATASPACSAARP